MIAPSRDVAGFDYLDLLGVCASDRGDSAQKLTTTPVADLNSDLSISFPDVRGRPITNRFDTQPICFAFIIGDVASQSALMHTSDGPLITVGNTLDFTLGGNSASFSTDLLNTAAQRVQICLNGTHAVLFINCAEVQALPFSTSGFSAVGLVAVLAEAVTLNNATRFDVSCVWYTVCACTSDTEWVTLMWKNVQ